MDIRLKQAIRKAFDWKEEVGIPADLKAGEIPEWDSFGNIALVAAIEETYQIRFKIEDMMNLDSIKNIQVILEKYDRGKGESDAENRN